MKIEEITQLLVHAQAVDNRQIEEITILEWHHIIHDLDFPTALEALRIHRRESDAWVLPVHIRRNVGRILMAAETPEDEYGNPLEPDVEAIKARLRLGRPRQAVTS